MPADLPAPPPLVPPDLWLQELKSHCHCLPASQPLDALGVLLGTYFAVTNWGRDWLGVFLGGTMIYLHGSRYLAGERVDCSMVC